MWEKIDTFNSVKFICGQKTGVKCVSSTLAGTVVVIGRNIGIHMSELRWPVSLVPFQTTQPAAPQNTTPHIDLCKI